MTTAPSSPGAPRPAFVMGLVAVLVAIAVVGYHVMEFVCDDAFITFRHVHNAREGHGLVWNPPPFRPVEGYTCFLWAVLLWGVWAVTGLDPTVTANPISLGFGILTVLLCVRVGVRLMRRGVDTFLVVVALLAIVANRTFATWMSSGLETAAFQFFLLWWVERATVPVAERSGRWLLVLSTAAALAALTRPDGLLCVVATVAIAFVERRRWRPSRALVGLAPLGVVVVQELWRRWTYGVWFPNTYYAKVTEPWPDAGVRYFASFVVEHGTWVPILVLCLVLPLVAVRALRARRGEAGGEGALSWPAIIAAATIAAQVGYYVLRVGGDHFEYRVLAPLVPIGALGTAALLGASRWPKVVARGVIVIFAVASLCGWGVLALSRPDYPYVSDRVPGIVRPITRVFDRWQAWLQFRRICVRREFHAQFAAKIANSVRVLPPGGFDAESLPVVTTPCVGIIGWALRDGCYVIDTLGLCDHVIARWTDRLPTDEERAALAPQLLAMIDPDASGSVEREEFYGMLARYGDAVTHRLWSDECTWESLLLLHDADDDGVLSGDERLRAVETLLPLRMMAHERRPPPGYVESFDANVQRIDGRIEVIPREDPLTPVDVERTEREWWEWIEDPTRPMPE